jgi:hypothetical protein
MKGCGGGRAPSLKQISAEASTLGCKSHGQAGAFIDIRMGDRYVSKPISDSGARYRNYFTYIHGKIKQYKSPLWLISKMDEE